MVQTLLSGIRVAFFGGSFDPPHLGHLAVARAARAALGLDRVLFAPVGAQPLKPRGSSAGFQDRLAMTRLAIAADPGFALSMADAPRPGGAPNFTLETLLALRAQLSPGAELFCLMGADSFLGMRRWHRAAEIPLAASLIVASRPGERLEDLQAALPSGLTLHPAPASPTQQPPAAAKAAGFSSHANQALLDGALQAAEKPGFVTGHDLKACPERSRTGAVNAEKSSWALQAAEKPDPEGGGGFNPRINLAESMRALALEGRFPPVSPESPSFSAASKASEGSFSNPSPAISAFSDAVVELRTYLLRNSAEETAPFYLLPGLEVEISASEIRRQLRAATRSRPSALLPDAVSDYIRTHGLYR
jgi:nicotinate-nucleotide adenylyltransferase